MRAMVYRGPYEVRVEAKDITGVVEEVGSSVQNVRGGDRVMVPFNIFCGTCWF